MKPSSSFAQLDIYQSVCVKALITPWRETYPVRSMLISLDQSPDCPSDWTLSFKPCSSYHEKVFLTETVNLFMAGGAVQFIIIMFRWSSNNCEVVHYFKVIETDTHWAAPIAAAATTFKMRAMLFYSKIMETTELNLYHEVVKTYRSANTLCVM